MANFLVFKENKAFNFTTERVLNMVRYQWVVCLYRCHEWCASVGNVLVWIAWSHKCLGTLLIKELWWGEWCDSKDGMFDLYLIYQFWIYCFSTFLLEVYFWWNKTNVILTLIWIFKASDTTIQILPRSTNFKTLIYISLKNLLIILTILWCF